MDCHLTFFNSFLCSTPDCQSMTPDENTLLNCFHTICAAHLKSGESGYCSIDECLLMLDKDSSLISIPAPLDRCENPISRHLAKQLSGLKATRENGNKCTQCECQDDLQFCIQCSTVWCDEHRQNIHTRIGKDHEFVALSVHNEEIVCDMLESSRDAPKSRKTDDELNKLIEKLRSRKQLMSINLVDFQNRREEFQEKTIRVREGAERDFDRIRRHIEIIREENLEKLQAHSDQFLRELDEKRQILRFKAEATERALNIALCVQNARLKSDENFVQLLKESNSLNLSDKLTESPNPLIDHINIPKVTNRISNELERLHSFQTFLQCDSSPHNAQYSLGHGNQTICCISKPIPQDKISKDTLINIYFDTELTSSVDLYYYYLTGYYYSTDETKFIIEKRVPDEHDRTNIFTLAENNEAGPRQHFDLFPGNPEGTVIKYIIIKVYNTKCEIKSECKYKYKFELSVKNVNRNISPQFSTLHIEPGHLTGLTKSRDRIFAVCKDANEIRRYDARPQIISQDTEDANPIVWNSEIKFGAGHLMDPRGICAFQSVIFVSDCFHHVVLCFGPDGSYISKFGGHGKRMGKFQSPMGLAVDQNFGKLIVADNGNNRIQILLLNHQGYDWESFHANEGFDLDGMPVDVKLDTLGFFFILTDLGELMKYDRLYRYCSTIFTSDHLCPLMPFFTIDNNDIIYLCTKDRHDKGCVYLITEKRGGEVETFYNLRRHPDIPKDLVLSGLTVDEDCRLYVVHNQPGDPMHPTRTHVFVSNSC